MNSVSSKTQSQTTQTELELEALDPSFYRGTGTFKFSNGDQYVGEYCAHRSGLVWREGFGTYTTQDKQVYKGEWREDKMAQDKPAEFSHPNGVNFCGFITENKYNGPGMYVLENEMALSCNFSNNKPTGDIILVDHKGNTWHGGANEDDAVLLREHVFFSDITDTAGKGRCRTLQPTIKRSKRDREYSVDPSVSSTIMMEHRQSRQSNKSMPKESKTKKSFTQVRQRKSVQSQTRSQKLSVQNIRQTVEEVKKHTMMKQIEHKVFSKTRKTASDLQFEDSGWYRNYVNFRNVYDNIKDKIDKDGEMSLTEDESIWYGKYQEFKKRYCEIMDSRKTKKKPSKEELFQLLSDEGFKSSCPPVSVIYATEDCGSICECKSAELVE